MKLICVQNKKNMKSISRAGLSPAAISVMTWGIYLVIVGVALMSIPDVVLQMFGYTSTKEVWPRLAGLLTLVLGGYYVLIAYYRVEVLFRWKAAGHTIGIVAMLLLYITDKGPSAILMTAVTDFFAGMWTVLALRFERVKLSA
jgi:hypothetical protein